MKSTKQKGNAAAEAMLEELKTAARTLRLDVREEELLRDAGYRPRSGACRVRDARVVLLDRRATVDDRIDALCAALAREDLERVFLSPALRARLGGRALRLASTTPAG